MRSRGTSLVELLVAAIVLGVAVTGITELIWLNTSWTSKYFNKTGSYFAIQNLLTNIRNDIDSTFMISATSNEQSLVLTRTSKDGFDTVGYPLTANSEQIQYLCELEIISGNPSGQFIITRRNLTKGTKTAILKGITGPLKLDGLGFPVIFQYVPKKPDPADAQFGIMSDASAGVGSVVVNVEVANRDMGKSRTAETSTSLVPDSGIRTEFFTRSELSAL